MKKFLIVFGYIVISFISLGTLFKLQHWPGSGLMLLMGLFLLSIIFLPVFFIQRMIEKKTALNIIVNILALFTTSTIFLGVMFKVMHWFGGGLMLVFGTTLFVFPTMILYVIQQFKEYDRKFSEFWRTVILSVIVSVFFFVYGLNYSKNILLTYLKIEDATIKTNANLKDYNNFILDEIRQNSNNNEYYSTAIIINVRTLELYQHIEELKKQLIIRTEGGETDGIGNHWNIQAKDNYDIPTHFIGNSGSIEGENLWNKLNLLKKTITEEIHNLPIENKKEVIDSLGDFGIETELNPIMNEGMNTWQERMFYNTPIVGTLALLSGIQNEILNAEFKALTLISKHIPKPI